MPRLLYCGHPDPSLWLRWALIAWLAYRVLASVAPPSLLPSASMGTRAFRAVSARSALPVADPLCTEALPQFTMPSDVYRLVFIKQDGTREYVQPHVLTDPINNFIHPVVQAAIQKACRATGDKGDGGPRGDKGDDTFGSRGDTGDSAPCRYK